MSIPWKLRQGRGKNQTPLETHEQQALFAWAEVAKRDYPELRWLFAIPNQGAARLKNLQLEGTKRGVPDICLPVPRVAKFVDLGSHYYNGLYIELKRTKGGHTSAEQFEWLAALSTFGYYTAICKGFEEAKQVIIDYLEGKL